MNNIIDYNEKIAFSEVYDIIMFLDEDDRNKIPNKFIEFIKNNKSDTYISKINPYFPLEKQKMQDITKAIVSYIFVKYLADENEKQEYRDKEIREAEAHKKEIEEKCKNMFNNTKHEIKVANEESDNNLPIVIEEKESFFDKIRNIFRRIFRK